MSSASKPYMHIARGFRSRITPHNEEVRRSGYSNSWESIVEDLRVERGAVVYWYKRDGVKGWKRRDPPSNSKGLEEYR